MKRVFVHELLFVMERSEKEYPPVSPAEAQSALALMRRNIGIAY